MFGTRPGMTNAMFHKIATAVVVIPLAAIIIAFAVANRQWVTLSFDPFSSTSPAFAATMPLFVLIVGGIAAWIRQSKWRRVARRLEGEVHALHEELAAQRRQFVGQHSAAAPEPEPLAVILPPTP